MIIYCCFWCRLPAASACVFVVWSAGLFCILLLPFSSSCHKVETPPLLRRGYSVQANRHVLQRQLHSLHISTSTCRWRLACRSAQKAHPLRRPVGTFPHDFSKPFRRSPHRFVRAGEPIQSTHFLEGKHLHLRRAFSFFRLGISAYPGQSNGYSDSNFIYFYTVKLKGRVLKYNKKSHSKSHWMLLFICTR